MTIKLLILPFIVCNSALAASLDSAESDLRNFRNDLEYERIILDQLDQEIDVSEEPELFPIISGENDNQADQGEYLTITVGGSSVTLEDVPIGEWFAPFVRDTAEREVVSGYRDEQGMLLGKFGPADPVTVEQLAKMSVESAGIDPSSCNGELKNESAQGSWSEQYVLCAESLGWAVFSDGSVIVRRLASRSEVVVTVMQAYGVSLTGAKGNIFSDVNSSVQFSSAIEKAAHDGIISGYSDERGVLTGEFKPSNPVNRAETAKIFSLSDQIYGN